MPGLLVHGAGAPGQVRRLVAPRGAAASRAVTSAKAMRELVEQAMFVGAAGALEQQLDVVGEPPEQQRQPVVTGALGPDRQR